MRPLVVTLVGLSLVGCGLYGYANSLSEAYETNQTATYDRNIDSTWEVLTNYEAVPKWSSQIVKVEKLNDISGHKAWRLTSKDGVQLEIQSNSAQKPFRQMNRILKSNTNYNGTWNLELKEQEKRTHVTLSERLVIASPWQRLKARYIKPKTIMQQYLLDAEKETAKRPNIPAEYP